MKKTRKNIGALTLIALVLAAYAVLAATPALPVLHAEGTVAKSSAMETKKDLQRGDEGFWIYAVSTLIIRFVGIFVVLGILQLIIQLQGRIFRVYEDRKKAAAAKAS